MKRGGAHVRASTRLNQLHPSRSQLVRGFRGPAPVGAANLSWVGGGVSPEWMGFAPSLTFMRQRRNSDFLFFVDSQKLRLSLRCLSCSDAVDLRHAFKEKRQTASKTQRCVCAFLCLCARGCVLMRCSLHLEPRPWEVVGMKLLCPPGTRLSTSAPLLPGFLVLLVVPQVCWSCR